MTVLFGKIPKRRNSDPEHIPDNASVHLKRITERFNIAKDEWFFISSYGIGDLYILLSLLPEFRKVHKAKKISVGIVKESHKDLFDLFPGVVDRYVVIGEKELKYCKSSGLESGKPIVIHPKDLHGSSLIQLIGYKSLNILDIYKVMLKLPMGSIPVDPRRHYSEISGKADVLFKKNDLLSGNTILLAPDAFSYDVHHFDLEFWKTLSSTLISKSYKVAVISHQKEIKKIRGIVPVNFPLREAIPFVEKCGFFIGNRSGFCDLISTSQAMKIILYPRIQWYSGPLIDGSSMVKMDLANGKTLEMEYDDADWKEKIVEIAGIICKGSNE